MGREHVNEALRNMPDKDTSKAADAYRVFLNYGKNFMTPDIIEYGWVSDNVAYELSSGWGIGGGTLYGVTFLDRRYDNPRAMEYSSAVEDEAAGRELIKVVKEELPHGA